MESCVTYHQHNNNENKPTGLIQMNISKVRYCYKIKKYSSVLASGSQKQTYFTSGNHMFKMFSSKNFPAPCVMGDESIMSPKAHGTSKTPVQDNLRWNCDRETADRICNFNRHYAEHSGYFEGKPKFLEEAKAKQDGAIDFYDSNTGKLLFSAPKGRSMDAFLTESRAHGWPSFRDDEVNWEFVRCLKDGETVSVDGTHLGHNIPDSKGSRYCINLVCVAGKPTK